MNSMFRVGLVGCGGIAHVHAAVLKELEETEFAACADIRPERALQFKKDFGCAAYISLEEMLNHQHLDAVHLCTPHYLHPMMAAQLATRGVAVFTEKPPAIDVPGWNAVLEAARRVPVGICFQNRYNANVLACQRILDQAEYGALRGIRAFVTWNRSAGYYTSTDWKGKWSTEGGGALINQAIHTLDLVIRFLGRPDQLESTMRNHHLSGVVEVEDTAEIWMRRGDVTALIYASTAYAADVPVLLELQFEKAAVRLENDSLIVLDDRGQTVIPCHMDASLGRSYWGAGHKSCIQDFYRSLQTGQPYLNRPETCRDTMDALLEIYRQNRSSLGS